MDRSKKRALEILEMYLAQAKEMAFIKTIILVGSLSDDTYTGNAGSDIDLIHIVSDREDYVWEKEQIFHLIDKIEEETGHAIPIARVVYQNKHLLRPYHYDFPLSLENKDLMQRPIEIFRILDSGITVYGEEIIGSIERPDRGDVEMSEKLEQDFSQTLKNTDWYREYIEMREKPSFRTSTAGSAVSESAAAVPQKSLFPRANNPGRSGMYGTGISDLFQAAKQKLVIRHNRYRSHFIVYFFK